MSAESLPQRPFMQKASAAAMVAKLRGDAHAAHTAFIEIADRCNEVCVHCYQIQGQKGEMSTQDIERILRELAAMGVLFLTFSGGEATLRRDFLHLVEYARKLRFAVKIYTNGLTMTRDLARRLGELAVQEVQISLYSQRAEVHDWVTGVPGAFDRTVAGVRFLIEAGVSVVLKSPLMSFNVAEYREYIEFVTALGAHFSIDPHLSSREDGDRTPQALGTSDADHVRIKRDLRASGRPIAAKSSRGALEDRPCGACSGVVHIEPNGEVRPCTQLSVPTGNALREGVAEAWSKNENARAIRTLTWGHIHGCRDCDLRAYCHRCFSDARLAVGDALAPYAGACRKARLEYEVLHGVPPEIQATGGRDGSIGPYAHEGGLKFRAIPDVLTHEDRALAERHGWIRSAAAPGSEPAPEVRPGGLVQLRRPGKKPSAEQVPDVPGSKHDAPARGDTEGGAPAVLGAPDGVPG